jgi:hypothetical protein
MKNADAGVQPRADLAAKSVAIKPGDERRGEELGHLKLALATFALQLDVFETRAHQILLAVDKLETQNLPIDGGPAYKDRGAANGWRDWSTKSPGNKSGT